MMKKYRRENGQSMLEFALILPIILIIIGGIIDFGWLFYNQSELNDAARVGTRFATVNCGSRTLTERTTAIQNKVNLIAPASVKPIAFTITYSNVNSPLLGDVTVTLKSNIKILTPVMGVFTKGQTKQLTGSVTMKVES